MAIDHIIMKQEIRKAIRAEKKRIGKEELLQMSLPATELIETNEKYSNANKGIQQRGASANGNYCNYADI